MTSVQGDKALKSRTPGEKLREELLNDSPLQIVGTINALAAMIAKRAGFRVIYLSGAGVANASYGLPDLGITTLDNVVEDARRITDAVDLPLLVDIDTGFGGIAFTIARTIKTLEKAGVAGVHIEDQETYKRCGHRPNKIVVSIEEMCDRLKVALDARLDPNFMIIARTDAFAIEGLDGIIERAQKYEETGADAIFPDALTSLEQYEALIKAVTIPVLANITEFGKTPLFTVEELRSVNVAMVLYPLTAFRAMYNAAENVYTTLIQQGTQKSLIKSMQTREELYKILDYDRHENIINKLHDKEKTKQF
ncbi:MAG: methylisocitrate lyase [Candidatus Hodarchaeales archaeon]|jgi:methylisocitrate lyase